MFSQNKILYSLIKRSFKILFRVLLDKFQKTPNKNCNQKCFSIKAQDFSSVKPIQKP